MNIEMLEHQLIKCPRISGEGNGNPLQYFCLENPMDGGTWQAAVHGVAKSRTQLSDFFHFSLSCIGEGNGKPLQCSCLENPRDGGAWWATVYGVAQSRTRLKRPSSSNYILVSNKFQAIQSSPKQFLFPDEITLILPALLFDHNLCFK